MKRTATTLAGLAVAAVAFAVTPSASAAPAPDLPPSRCVWEATQFTGIYEDTTGTKFNDQPFTRIPKWGAVSGPCANTVNGMQHITHYLVGGDWKTIHSFEGDKDYARARFLHFVGLT